MCAIIAALIFRFIIIFTLKRRTKSCTVPNLTSMNLGAHSNFFTHINMLFVVYIYKKRKKKTSLYTTVTQYWLTEPNKWKLVIYYKGRVLQLDFTTSSSPSSRYIAHCGGLHRIFLSHFALEIRIIFNHTKKLDYLVL